MTPRCPAELLSVLPHDRGRRLQPDADTTPIIDIGALGGNAPDDVLGSQYRRHVAATLTRRFAIDAIVGVKRF
jgi:hypothetical protein